MLPHARATAKYFWPRSEGRACARLEGWPLAPPQPAAILRDAPPRGGAPQDEVEGWRRYDSNLGNALL